MAMGTAAEKWAFGLINDEDPQPDDCVVHALQLVKQADNPKANLGTILFIAGFIGHAWGRWPDRVEAWTHEFLAELPPKSQNRRSLLFLALGCCPDSIGTTVLEALEPLNPVDAKEMVAGLGVAQINPAEMEPQEGYHLDFLWGCFFGSGNTDYLRQICMTIPWLLDDSTGSKKRSVAEAAHWSVSGHLNANHIGVILAMNTVYDQIPELHDAMTHISDSMLEAQSNPHTA